MKNNKFVNFLANLQIILFFALFIFIVLNTYGFSKADIDYKNFTEDYYCKYSLNQIDFYDLEITGKKLEVKKYFLNSLLDTSQIQCLNKVVDIEDGWPEIRITLGDDNSLFQILKFCSFSSLFFFLLASKKNISYLSFYLFFICNLIVNYLFSSDFRNPEFESFYSYEFIFLETLVVYFLFLSVKNKMFLNEITSKLLKLLDYKFNRFFLLSIPLAFSLRSLYKFNLDKIKPQVIQEYIINYEFGFIRRGLLGTFYNLFTEDIFTIGYIYVPVTIFFIHFLYTFFILKIYNIQKKSNFDIFIIYAPSLIMFQLFLISGGPGYKELFGITSLLIILFGSKSEYKNYVYLGFLLFNISIYIHEINLFFIGFLFYITRNHKNFKSFVILSILNIFNYLFNYFYNSKPIYVSIKLCENFFAKFSNLKGYTGCSKSSYLEQDFTTSLELTNNRVYEDYQYIFVYIVYFILILAPFFIKNFIDLAFSKIILIFIQILPLFVIAIDWGRWLFIFSNLIFLIYFESENRPKNLKIIYPSTYLVVFFTYIFAWRIPYCCVEDLNVINLIRINKLNITFFISFLLLFILEIKRVKKKT